VSEGVRLAVWSGPRNISTALMRSWENRPDCRVVDEPLYAFYLSETGIDHPGRVESIAAGETDWRVVVSELTAPAEGVYYQKHMAHHLVPTLPREWIGSLSNILLIRNPRDVVASYVKSRSEVSLSDLGVVQLTELYEELGESVPVVDADDFLEDPEPYLRWMCELVGIEFTDRMLSWPPGRRESDGVWAPYWYDNVISSTGFERRGRSGRVELEPSALEVVEQSRPYYERLQAVRTVL
jgi:Sulfotransferase domain